MTGASSALLRLETHYVFTPGSERALGAEGQKPIKGLVNYCSYECY